MRTSRHLRRKVPFHPILRLQRIPRILFHPPNILRPVQKKKTTQSKQEDDSSVVSTTFSYTIHQSKTSNTVIYDFQCSTRDTIDHSLLLSHSCEIEEHDTLDLQHEDLDLIHPSTAGGRPKQDDSSSVPSSPLHHLNKTKTQNYSRSPSHERTTRSPQKQSSFTDTPHSHKRHSHTDNDEKSTDGKDNPMRKRKYAQQYSESSHLYHEYSSSLPVMSSHTHLSEYHLSSSPLVLSNDSTPLNSPGSALKPNDHPLTPSSTRRTKIHSSESPCKSPSILSSTKPNRSKVKRVHFNNVVTSRYFSVYFECYRI